MNGRFFFHFLKISTKWKGSHTEKTQASILDYVAFPKNFVQFLCESCKKVRSQHFEQELPQHF